VQRKLRHVLNSIGHWGFTIMIIPKRGEVRRLVIPWLGAIGCILVTVLIGYFIGYYPYGQIIRTDQQLRIRQLEASKARLKKENDSIRPALARDKQQADLLNRLKAEHAAALGVFQSVRRKVPASLTSRGSVSRPTPYGLPVPVVAPGDGEVSLLATLESNTASLAKETARQLAEAKALRAQLEAYERELDHTPSILPVHGRLTSRFGYRKDPVYRGSAMHTGVDLAIHTGTSVRAAADGIIAEAGWQGGYGRTVVINHGYGYKTLYGHNSSLLVKAGQAVKKGQVIAQSGSSGKSTGPHVHFEIWLNGHRINPLTVVR